MKIVHSSLVLLGGAALALVVGGCQKEASSAADPAAVKNAIKADETKWNDQFKSKDAEGLIGHYADDAFFAAPQDKPFRQPTYFTVPEGVKHL